jgi:hypothetical protein
MGLTFSRVWERMVRSSKKSKKAKRSSATVIWNDRPWILSLHDAKWVVPFFFSHTLSSPLIFIAFSVRQEGDAHSDGRSRCRR